ncbi:tripartite tricarboxylate transporter TctB family protein [Ancylobacter sonchi]|uniref:tripartite tricarboxylate transporter TctB family protein n=1 Tax=Ancylobacter sonchi TaxID=1937790 RepID=UPI001BD513C3|nr:tripartite tricarboxylate transporter TctB family protein [Ancylobacter sonchi]MBS7535994.1 tripartite tricarboxylate transporter TctB family protein [Ancylobacter sonchi]
MSLVDGPLRNPRPVIVGAIFAASGTAFLVTAQGYEGGSALHMGPGYFPTLVAVLLVLIGLVNIGSAFRASEREGLRHIAWRPLLVIAAAVLVFSVLIAATGLIPAIAGLVVVSLFATGVPSLRETLLLIVVVEIICLSIFHFLLGLQVPLVVL